MINKLDENKMVDILLATYNGDRFLEQQLLSVISQSYQNWNLIIRDDGSDDKTEEIIKQYKDKYPNKIIIIKDQKKNLGSCFNFFELLSYSNANYLMFCDQDDVWIDKKVEITLKNMLSLEEKHPKGKPILVHSDLKMIDSRGETISESFWRYQRLDVKKGMEVGRVLTQNFVTGSTLMINKPLKDLFYQTPDFAIMHDWWFAILACYFGEVFSISLKTVYYRQHSKNVIGSKKFLSKEKLKKDFKKNILDSQKQANCFYKLYKNFFEEREKLTVETYIDISENNYIKRIFLILKYGLLKHGLLRNFGFFYYIKKI